MHILLKPSTFLVVHHTMEVICLALQSLNFRYRLLIVFDQPSVLLTIRVRMWRLGV